MRSEAEDPSQWHTEQVDLVEHLKQIDSKKYDEKGIDSTRIYAVAVLSNSQRTKSKSEGCFGPLMFSSRPKENNETK